MTTPSRVTPIETTRAGAGGTAWWPEAAILLLAALTRFWRLAYHSIWFDEAVSLKWAGWAPMDMWRITFQLVEEKHPPLYYLFLHGWQRLLELFGQGHNDGLLRASGAALGVLTVAGLLLLVRRVGGVRTARAAGLFTALAPALVWYSQELRMFQPAATLLVWAGVCLVAAWMAERGWVRLLLWAGMAALLAGAVHTYLFAALLLPSAGLTVLLLWVSRRAERRRLLEGVAATVLTAALVLPLARNAWLVNSAENSGAPPFADLSQTLDRLLRTWTMWRPGWPVWLETTALLLCAGLLAAGLLLPRMGHTQPSRVGPERGWLALWVMLPVLLGNLVLAGNDSIFAEDRYFVFVAPFALWAMARGALLLGERLPWRAHLAPTAGVALLLLAALPVLWTPARYREQWRAATGWISAQVEASPGERSAVITHVDYTHIAAEWYLRPRFSFEDLPLYHPFGGTLTPDMVESVIAPPLHGVETEGFETLYLLQSHLEGVDDERLVEGWLNAHYPLAAEAYPPGLKLSVYTVRSHYEALPPLAPGATLPATELAPGLQLAACEVLTPEVAVTNPALNAGPSWAMVRLWWQRDGSSTGEMPTGLRSRVRLSNEEGVWGESAPRPGNLWERHPPTEWQPGDFWREDVDVALNAEAPSGPLAAEVRLLDGQGGEPGLEVNCGAVVIGR